MAVWALLLDPIMRVLDKVIPDKDAREKAQIELLRMSHEGEMKALDADLQIALAQSATNTAEASSPCAFRGGWRPLIGYICAAALGYQFILQPLLTWASGPLGWPAPPSLETGDLMTILLGMLGLGGFRTYERLKGAIPPGR